MEPEDRRLLEALSRSGCPSRRFRGSPPVPSRFLQAAALALLAFSAIVFAARVLA